jgi:hypothetical protein
MMTKSATACLAGALLCAACATAQDAPAAPQITMGDGEANMIEMEGLTRAHGVTTFSGIRVDDSDVTSFRADSTAITFPKVVIETTGFLVLHPVIDGRPNGDMVSGFSYLEQGQNEDVTIRIDHPANPGDRFLVMLHKDVDQDRVLDFVFVEDGINVEDTAVFEGTHMIAHVFAVPE